METRLIVKPKRDMYPVNLAFALGKMQNCKNAATLTFGWQSCSQAWRLTTTSTIILLTKEKHATFLRKTFTKSNMYSLFPSGNVQTLFFAFSALTI